MAVMVQWEKLAVNHFNIQYSMVPPMLHILTSCLCPTSRPSIVEGDRTSLCKISLSLLPDDKMSPFQAKAPTFHI